MKIVCVLIAAATVINGLDFVPCKRGVVSADDLPDDVANGFLEIPGYEPESAEPAPVVDPAAAKAAKKAADKAAKDAADKAAADAEAAAAQAAEEESAAAAAALEAEAAAAAGKAAE